MRSYDVVNNIQFKSIKYSFERSEQSYFYDYYFFRYLLGTGYWNLRRDTSGNI